MPDEVRKSIIGHRWRKNGVDGRYLNKRKKLLIHCIDNKFSIDPEEETDIWLPRWEEKKRRKSSKSGSKASGRPDGPPAKGRSSSSGEKMTTDDPKTLFRAKLPKKKPSNSGSGFSKSGTKVVHPSGHEERPKT